MPRLLALLLTLPVLAIVSDSVAEDDAAAARQKAMEIIERAIKAQGGDERIAKMQTMARRLKAKVFLPDGKEVPFQLDNVWQMPDRYRSTLTMSINNLPIVRTLIINGDKGWIDINGYAKELTPREMQEFKDQIYAERMCQLAPLRRTDCKFMILDEIKIARRTIQGINIERPGHRDVNLYFDKATGLLVKMEHVIMGANGLEASQEVYFAGYTSTRGPKHWRRIAVFNDGVKIFEAEVVRVRYLDKVDDRWFAPPKNLKKPETTGDKK